MNKTITIKEIFKNDYKTKEGYYYTLIDTEETYYNSFNYDINTNINMGHIAVGKTYELEYSSTERNGKIFNTIANFGMEIIDVEEEAEEEFKSDSIEGTTNEPTEPAPSPKRKAIPIAKSPMKAATGKVKKTLTKEEKWDMKESEKNEYIVKESALKSAVEAVPTLNPEASVEDIIAIAIRFVKFIKKGA